MAGKASKTNLHRETLRACLRIINTAETLDQARIQLARLLNVFDKLEAQGVTDNAAVRAAEEWLAISPPPKTSSADKRPVRRRAGPAWGGSASARSGWSCRSAWLRTAAFRRSGSRHRIEGTRPIALLPEDGSHRRG
jgi:hypothetical protein